LLRVSLDIATTVLPPNWTKVVRRRRSRISSVAFVARILINAMRQVKARNGKQYPRESKHKHPDPCWHKSYREGTGNRMQVPVSVAARIGWVSFPTSAASEQTSTDHKQTSGRHPRAKRSMHSSRPSVIVNAPIRPIAASQ